MPTCSKCQTTFSRADALIRHERTNHSTGSKGHFSCELCNYSTPRKDTLSRHIRLYHKLAKVPSVTLGKSDQSSTRDVSPPGLTRPFDGGGSEVLATYQPDCELGSEDRVCKLLHQNMHVIGTYKKITNRLQDLYNFENTTPTTTAFAKYLDQIFLSQKHAFKINMAMGFVLTNYITGEPRYYYASRNNRFFPHPFVIKDAADIKELKKKLDAIDILEHCRQQRPNTKWTVNCITNVLFYVDKLKKFHIGSPECLPDFLTKSRSILTFHKDRRGNPYNDDLCFHRCLAYHLNKHVLTDDSLLEQYVFSIVRRYREWSTAGNDLNGGVTLDDLTNIEECFNIAVEVYSLQLVEKKEDLYNHRNTVGILVRRSIRMMREVMYLDLCGDHFSYIKDLKAYTCCWQCNKCHKLFDRRHNCHVHQRTCSVATTLVFPGGGYGLPKSLFDLLEEYHIQTTLNQRYFPFRIAFDFEALIEPYNDPRDGKDKLLHRLTPASVSVCSNVPGFETPVCFISNGKPDELIKRMYEYIKTISIASYDILSDQYQSILVELSHYVDELDSLIEQADMAREDLESESRATAELLEAAYRYRPYRHLQERFEKWLQRIPVLGFNSGSFDINLIRKHFFPFLLENGIEIEHIIKRGNDYLSISTEHAVFLDMKNYLAAGTSYDKWLKSSDIAQSKGFFPYAWFSSLEKLDQKFLPPIEAFYSELRGCGVTVGDYRYLQKVWLENDFRCMRDLLVWYNNKDVEPFVLAASKFHDYWKSLGIECFKGGMISLPGLALSLLIQTMTPHTILPLFSDMSKDLYHTIKDNVVGGLSVVMHRYHEAHKTRLPNGRRCSWVYSHDCNALYLYALGQPTGTGVYSIWRPADDSASVTLPWQPSTTEDLKPPKDFQDMIETNMKMLFTKRSIDKWVHKELEWLEWTSEQKNVVLEHKYNGRQKVVYANSKVRYPVDGYDRTSNTVYQFHGCYWHGHGCVLDGEKDDVERKRRREDTAKKSECIRELEYAVVEKWECEWEREKKNDPNIFKFLHEHLKLGIRQYRLSASQLVRYIKGGQFFGLIECDIEVPRWRQDLIGYFAEFPPICKNTEVGLADIGETMRWYAEQNGYMGRPRRCLINSYWGCKMLFSTPFLCWCLQKGLVITRIYQAIEMKPKPCFQKMRETVAHHRRRADANPEHKSLGESWKTVGNSSYGKPLTNKENHKDTVIKPEKAASQLVNDKRFNKMEEVGDVAYEICLDKKTVKLDLPITVSFFVYQYAKLRMLEFVYDFLKHFLRPGSYQMVCSDTDSIIAAYESKDMDSLVKDDLRLEYNAVKPSFLVTDDYSLRTPGLFKEEWSGTGIVALCSKTYITWKDDGKKISTKGLSKRTNDFGKQDFLTVLETEQRGTGVNYGFRVVKDGLFQYRQFRNGLTYLYVKRRVLPDGVSTTPLLI